MQQMDEIIVYSVVIMYSTVTWKQSKTDNFKDNIPPSKGTPSALSV